MLDIWIQAIRPRTLVAAIFPVAIGTSLAYDMGRFALLPAFLCLGFALLIQIFFIRLIYKHIIMNVKRIALIIR